MDHFPLLADEYVAALVTGARYSRAMIARAYASRFLQLFEQRNADLYWIYAELFPFFPAHVEELAAAGKKIVYDYDDAFFHSYDRNANPFVRTFLGGKHARLLKHAAACICGNSYLQDFAMKYCDNSIIVPTVVDTAQYRPVSKRGGRSLTIGWIGSPTTWPQVRPILSVLEEVTATFGARVLVVGAGLGGNADAFPGMELREWTEDREILDVQEMDIGIMPLKDEPFERGKSGYKLIQYMACGVPVIASPVGINAQLVNPGISGLLASNPQEWRQAMTLLLTDPSLRKQFGQRGRLEVERNYSLASQQSKLVKLFQSLV